MLVTRKERRGSKKPEQRTTRMGKTTPDNKQTIYNNQLFNPRFAPLSVLEDDDPIENQKDIPRGHLLQGESSRGH